MKVSGANEVSATQLGLSWAKASGGRTSHLFVACRGGGSDVFWRPRRWTWACWEVGADSALPSAILLMLMH